MYFFFYTTGLEKVQVKIQELHPKKESSVDKG